MRRWFLRGVAGNFTTMTALIFPAVIAIGALAIDQGTLHLERRQLQSAADLAAIAAAADPARAEAIVKRTFADQGLEDVTFMRISSPAPAGRPIEGVQVEIVPGVYSPDPNVEPAARFKETANFGNAIRVRARKSGSLFFGSSIRPVPIIGVGATGSNTPEASFSIGSRLARLDGGIANQLLASLTGRPISLSVMDYQSLLSADVSLFAFLDTLNTRLQLNAGTYDQLLDTQLTLGSLASAMAGVEGLQASAAASLRRLALQLGTTKPVLTLRGLLDLGARGKQPTGPVRRASDPRLSVMELFSSAMLVAVANGKRQVEADLNLGLPGLADLKLALAVGEPTQGSGWLKLGTAGDIIHTAQTRLSLVATIGGAGGILGASIRVPLHLDIASAEARLASVECPDGRPSSARVGIDAKPGLAGLQLADATPARLSDFSRPVPLTPAALITLPAVTVTGSANLAVSNLSPKRLTFIATDIEKAAVKQVSTRDVTKSLTASLFDTLQLNVRLAGIDLGLGQILAGTLRTTLMAAAPLLDNVLSTVLGTLGVSIGEADVRVHGVRCGAPVLVQ